MKKSYPIHPAAAVLPLIEGDARGELKKALHDRGQLVPIQLLNHKGKPHVLDGRNRQELLLELGMEPKYTRVDLRGRTPQQFVVDINLERRQLSASQKGWLALKLMPELKKKAKERQAAGGKKKKVEGASSAAKAAAQTVKVSTRTVERAIAIEKQAPHLGPDIASGKVTLKQAEKKIRRAEQNKVVAAYVPAEGVFQMHTLDFSWPYRDTREGNDNQRGLPYPPQTLEEIVAYTRGPFAKGCDPKGCVLGNWITGPISIDSSIAPVVQREFEALGFKMIHERIWEKTRATGGDFIGQGASIRWNAEKLQIYTRGDVATAETGGEGRSPLQHTVFRAHVGEHSEKPQRAYDDLQALFPLLTKRLEHHARAPRIGWTGTGAELLAKPSMSGESAPAQSAPAVQTETPSVATSGGSFSSGAGLGVPQSERSESKRGGKVAEALSIEQLRDRVAKTLKEKGRAPEELKQLGAKVVADGIVAMINAPPTEEQKRRAAQMLREGSLTIEKVHPSGQAVAGATVGASREANGGAKVTPSPLTAAPKGAELFPDEYVCADCGEVFVALEVLSKHSKRCTGVGPAKPGAIGFETAKTAFTPPLVPGSTSAVDDDGVGF